MLSFKGVDNASLLPAHARRPALLHGLHGHGQHAQPVHPSVLRLIMDSLRYWVTECHVDGFRFDLAARWPASSTTSTACRRSSTRSTRTRCCRRSSSSPSRGTSGPGGYQVGNFPVLWSEWNGIYRDTMRDFWRGEASVARVRLAPDRLERPLRGRRPPPVRLDQLHHRPRRLHAARPRLLQREAQRGQPRGQPGRHRRQPLLELRRRGRRPTTRRSTRCARRQQRNFLATLLLSQGTPMLLGGDEFGRTQGGNNNAWCQDNEISWFDWDLGERTATLLAFTRRLIAPAPRAPRVPPRGTSSGARASRARACPTSGGSGPTAGA